MGFSSVVDLDLGTCLDPRPRHANTPAVHMNFTMREPVALRSLRHRPDTVRFNFPLTTHASLVL